MLNIVFLCSGGGGNLRFIAEAIRHGLLVDAQISAVIIDRECPAAKFARECNIPVFECNFSEENQIGVLRTLTSLNPGVIVTNVHRIISANVVDSFKGKMINLHYSLLPAFGGVVGVKALTNAIAYGSKIVGATVHLVDDSVDSGTPLIQAAIPVNSADDLQSLMDTLFRAGCMSLLTGIEKVNKNGLTAQGEFQSLIKVSGRSVMFSPPVMVYPELKKESFWSSMKLAQ